MVCILFLMLNFFDQIFFVFNYIEKKNCMYNINYYILGFNCFLGNILNMFKINVDMIEFQYNEIDENIYDKIEIEF